MRSEPMRAFQMSRSQRRTLWTVPVLCCGLLLQGCAGQVSSGDANSYDGAMARGDYSGAASFATAVGHIDPEGKSINLLWSLDAGAAMVYAGPVGNTNLVFDHAEAMMRQRDLGDVKEIGQYKAATYDGIMLDIYSATAYLHGGRRDEARVQFNRADDRVRRAEESFQKDIAAAAAKLKADGSGDIDAAGTLLTASNSPEYQATLKDMDQYSAYEPFISPLALYLHGVFFLTAAQRGEGAGDYAKALQSFQRVEGMAGARTVLTGDMAAAKAGKYDATALPNTWVVFEDGKSPSLASYIIRIAVPIVGKHSHVGSMSIAMPRMVPNGSAYAGLLVGAASVRTERLGSFDSVMATEFRKCQPSVLQAAVLEGLLKMVAQTAMAQTDSPLLMLAAEVGSNISTTDTRSWTSLPKDFQAARIVTPKDGMVSLHTDTGVDLGSVQVPTDHSSIIYVKILQTGAIPGIQVLPL